MRISFVLPDANLGGGTRVIAIHAHGLLQRGHEVLLVSTPKRRPPLRRRLSALLAGHTQPPRRASHLDGMPLKHRVIEKCRPIVDEDLPDADVVIATWWETAPWVMALSARKGAKAYFIQGDERSIVAGAGERVTQTWRLPMHRIAISRWLTELVGSHVEGGQVDLVPNAVDMSQFDSPPRGKQAVPTIGMVHSHSELKGCDLMLEAVRQAQGRVPGLHLKAFGQRTPDTGLALPAGSSFTRHPAQETLREIYAGCDAWLFGSRREGFGLPILEAMACRTPVIAMPAGAAPELLAGGGGVLLSEHSPTMMAAGIEQVCMASEAQWRALSDAAYQTAKRYTWAAATDLFEAALFRAVEREGLDYQFDAPEMEPIR